MVAMLKSVKIQNYRGIKNAEIKDLDRINIFIGRNGSGKSSILEALYLLRSGINNTSLIPEYSNRQKTLLNHIIDKSGYRYSKYLTGLWHKYDTKNSILIKTEWSSDRKIDIVIQYHSPDRIIIRIVNIQEHNVLYETEASINTPFLQPYGTDISKVLKKEEYEYICRICLIDDIISRSLKEIEEMDFQILKEKWRDKELLDILNEVYKTAYQSIEYLKDKHDVRIAFLEPNMKVRLYYDELPDGIKYGFAYLIRAMHLEGSALLIEEIENHQHPGSIEKLLEALFEFAVQKNVQLFFTTHSMEVFNDAVDLASKYPVNLFHVTQPHPGEASVRKLKTADAQLLKSMDVDIVKLEDVFDKMIDGLKDE